MKAYWKSIIAILSVQVLIFVFMPWKTTVVPAVRVQVFDETGKPAAGVRVEQEWSYEAFDDYSESARTVTGSDGFVAFPQRSIRISVARKTIGFLASMLPLMCGYGFGPEGSIQAFGPDSRANDIVVCDVNNAHPRPLKLTRWDLAH